MSEVPPDEYTEDTEIWPLMVQMQQCLCETLAERGLLPGDCFCAMTPGSQATWDYSQGQAWVRLTSVFPSSAFPQQSFALNNCGTTLAAELEVGVLQCTPVPRADGSPPTVEQAFESTRLQMATMAAVRYAIMCCAASSDIDLLLGAYEPMGPQGGLVGGAWTVNIGRA